MTRADCQALSKHHHVCWLSIPCPQHKIGGQRIIGVRDGKDIWGQPVHPSAFSYPWFQIIPYIIFSPPGFCTVFTVFTQPQPSPLGNDAGGSIQFLLSRERYCLCPQLTFVNFFVGGLSWEAEAHWMSPSCLVMSFSRRRWRAFVCDDTE